MGKPVLLLRLEGPLQSWGTRSRWDVRDTQTEPTKSGVIGLLGCALGYTVGEELLETELDRGLRFGVRVESTGRVMRDYQTVTDYLPTADGGYKHDGVKVTRSLEKLRREHAVLATIISPRFYLEDAAFLVALEETGACPGLLGRCADALRHPRWPIYLGRKACIPTRPVPEPDQPSDEYDGIEDALARHPWSWLGSLGQARRRPAETLVAYVEDEAGELRRQDAVRTNAARLYEFRQARRIYVQPPRAADGGDL